MKKVVSLLLVIGLILIPTISFAAITEEPIDEVTPQWDDNLDPGGGSGLTWSVNTYSGTPQTHDGGSGNAVGGVLRVIWNSTLNYFIGGLGDIAAVVSAVVSEIPGIMKQETQDSDSAVSQSLWVTYNYKNVVYGSTTWVRVEQSVWNVVYTTTYYCSTHGVFKAAVNSGLSIIPQNSSEYNWGDSQLIDLGRDRRALQQPLRILADGSHEGM